MRIIESSSNILKNETNSSFGLMGRAVEINRDRRALVIDVNAGTRKAICDMLSSKGYEISACNSVEEARKSFCLQPLIVSGCHTENGEIQRFINHVRNKVSDNEQPYVIALKDKDSGQIFSNEGIDQIVSTPIDSEEFLLKVEAAQLSIAERMQGVTGNWNPKVAIQDKDLGDLKPPVPLFDSETVDLAKQLLGVENLQAPNTFESKDKESQKTVEVRRGTGKAKSHEDSGLLSHSDLRLMVEACPLAMAMFDQSMAYMFANASWRDAFGLPVSILEGKSHFKLFPKASEQWQLLCGSCLQEEVEKVGEELVEWADGNREWIRWIMRPWFAENGELGGLVVCAQSIQGEKILDSERRYESDLAAAGVELNRYRSEIEKLEERCQDFRSITDSAPCGMVMLGRDGNTIYCNEAAQETVGSNIASFETIEEWLRAYCPNPSERDKDDLVNLWLSRIWKKGAAGVFPVRTDNQTVIDLEFRPKLMEDGRLLLTVFDVTDARRGEEALRASEEKFRSLFNDSGIGIALLDSRGKVFDSNVAIELMLGVAKDQLRGCKIEEFLDEEGTQGFQRLHQDVTLGGGRGGQVSVRLKPSEGGRVIAHLHLSVVRDKSGGLVFTTCFMHEISEQLLIGQGLKNPRALLDASPDMVAVIDDAGYINDLIIPSDFSLQVERNLSIGRRLSDAFPQININTNDILNAVSVERVVTLNLHYSNEKSNSYYELRAARGDAENTIIILRDITELHEFQTKLRWQAVTFSHIHEAIVVADFKGKIIDWNPASERLFGYSKDQIIGHSLHEIYGVANSYSFQKEFSSAIRVDGRWESRSDYTHADGSTGTCDSVYVTLKDEDGTPIALVGVSRDACVDSSGVGIVRGLQGTLAEMQRSINSTLKMISTVLSLGIADEDSLSMSINKARVDALALLESHVGNGGDYTHVNFGKFASSLVKSLIEIAPHDSDPSVYLDYGILKKVTGESEVEVQLKREDVILPVSLARPLALMSNELLTNIFIHGCSDCDKVTVNFVITISQDGNSGKLSFTHDGSPLPERFEVDEDSGTGFKIVRGLAKRVGGALEINQGLVTEFCVGFRFPEG